MSFAIFTDSCSNLSRSLCSDRQIETLPCTYTIDGRTVTYEGDIDAFDAHAHYDLLRGGKLITTSLLNTHLFVERFRPVLEAGRDLLYIGMSAGISGTFQACTLAIADLAEEFPDRVMKAVDSMGAGFGTGLLTLMAADLRDSGMALQQVFETLEKEKMNLCEYFTVDDLMFLKRTGRVSTASAVVGTMLGIKPILRGDETGHIVVSQKCRGRKKAIDALTEIYKKRVVHPENQVIAISHGDCEEEAKALAEKLTAIAAPKQIMLCPHEPMTGSHVGPGMLGLFFFGSGR